MTTTETRSQIATSGRVATWVFAIGLAVLFIGVAVMSTDAVMFGAILAVVGLAGVIVCGALRLFGKR